MIYATHRNIEGGPKPSQETEPIEIEMRKLFPVAILLAGSLLAVAQLSAQTTPANPAQNPPPAPAQPAQGNEFPTDTTNVPVMPSKEAPPLPEGSYGGDDSSAPAPRLPVPAADQDPARSPDDLSPDADANSSASSDSRTGLEKVLGDTDSDAPAQGKHRKLKGEEPEHQETSAEDIQVGGYYLEKKNWKAAQSRFESAMVLSPDDPGVYWGLAEAARHLGNLAVARGYYQKVAEYDPDSKHGKEAIKALKDPEIANAKAQAPASAAK